MEVFFYSQGIVHSKISEGRTIKKELYLDILHHLKESISDVAGKDEHMKKKIKAIEMHCKLCSGRHCDSRI